MICFCLQPLVDAELLADFRALDDKKLLVELLLQFALPLESEVCWTDDTSIRSANPRKLQFSNEQPGHDGLAGTRVVGEQEPDTGELQKVVVDGFELVRQRIDTGNRKAKVRIKLVGDSQRIGLEAQAQ